MANYTFCEAFKFLSKTGFLSLNNFGSRYASRSVKGSKGEDHTLVSKKNLSQGMVHWVGAQGQTKLAKISKISPLVTSSPENSELESKKFFSTGTRKLSEFVEGLNSSLALEAGDLWPKKCRPLQWPAGTLKFSFQFFFSCFSNNCSCSTILFAGRRPTHSRNSNVGFR